MTDNIAILDGYTVERRAIFRGGTFDGPVLFRRAEWDEVNAGERDSVRVWDMDAQEYIVLRNLWDWEFENEGGL